MTEIPQETVQPSALEQQAAEAAQWQGMSPEEQMLAQASRDGRVIFLPETNVVNSVSLSKAQGIFIKAQTRFLLQRFNFGTQEYLTEQTAYCRAQTDYIDALQIALHQAGAI